MGGTPTRDRLLREVSERASTEHDQAATCINARRVPHPEDRGPCGRTHSRLPSSATIAPRRYLTIVPRSTTVPSPTPRSRITHINGVASGLNLRGIGASASGRALENVQRRGRPRTGRPPIVVPDLKLADEDGAAVDADRPSEPQRWARTRGSSTLSLRIATWVHPLPRGDAKLVGRPVCSLALQTSNTSPLNR